MNISELTENERYLIEKLRDVLNNNGINPNDYSLFEGEYENTVCLNKADGKWLVYTIERGKRTIPSEYISLSKAIADFISCVSWDNDKKNRIRQGMH